MQQSVEGCLGSLHTSLSKQFNPVSTEPRFHIFGAQGFVGGCSKLKRDDHTMRRKARPGEARPGKQDRSDRANDSLTLRPMFA